MFCFPLMFPPIVATLLQKYFGTAVGKGAQAARVELEKLNFDEMMVEQAVHKVAEMFVVWVVTTRNRKVVDVAVQNLQRARSRQRQTL